MANLNIGNSTANVKVTLNQNGDVHFRNGSLDFDSSSLPQFSGTPQYLVGIESFANGGTLKWAEKASVSVGSADKFTSAKSITLTGDVTGTTSSQAGWSIVTTANKLTSAGHLDTVEKLDAFIESNKLKFATVASIGGVASDGMIISVPWNNSWGHQIFLDDSAMVMQHRHRYTKTNSDGSTAQAWSGWATLLDSNNYNNYAPSKTGTGASGTWGINISGNSATATKLATARTISLTGSVTGSGTFDGSGNLSISTTTNHSHNSLSYKPILNSESAINSFHAANTLQAAVWTDTSFPGVGNGIILDMGYTSATYGAQIAIDDDPTYFMALRQKNGNGWNAWKRIPMGDGTGASGTWGISISGNAATATKATQDSAGQQINTTYIKGLSVSGKTITYTKGDGTTGTITTQDTNTTYGVATSSANGLMSSADKSKLDGIAAGANKYSHPTSSGNKHIPAGGSAGQILRWSADGTAAWGADNNTTYSVATTSSNGLMSSSDKTKLNKANINVYKMSNIDTVATGSSNYVDIGFCSGYNNSFGGTYICISISWQGYAIQFRMGQGASTVKTRCTNTSKQWTSWH